MNVSGISGSQEEIEQLFNKFDKWRKSKKSPKDRIPDELWAEAVKLAETFSVHRVSKRLGLSYVDLKKRMGNWNVKNISDSSEAEGFLELKVSSPSVTVGRSGMGWISPCIMEIIRSDGTQLRVYSTHGVTLDITRICESLVKNEKFKN